MKRLAVLFVLASIPAAAQVPVTPAANQASFLADKDPHLAANKKLVYDFWRTLLVAGHTAEAEKYMAEGYIQHNPMVPTGRAAFVEMRDRIPKKADVPATIPNLVAITADGDLVTLAFLDENPNPAKPGTTYTTTRFDMLRVSGGKVVEHWDDAHLGEAPPGPPPTGGPSPH